MALLLYIVYKIRTGENLIRLQDSFSNVVLLAVASIGLECISIFVEGRDFCGALLVHEMFTVAYFGVTVVISLFWLPFLFHMLELDFWRKRWRAILLCVPSFVGLFLCLSNFWLKWLFHIDEVNIYYEGPLYVLYVLCCLFYMVVTLVMTGRRLLLKRYYAEHSLYFALASFGIFPFFGIFLRMVAEDVSLSSPGLTMSLFLIFVTMQTRLISLDPLTQINNRNQLNYQLKNKYGSVAHGKHLYLFVMDVDEFKAINDTYGHNEGDNALLLVAETLKRVCGPRGHFISRFGGDEFNVVAELENDCAADELATDIRKCALMLSEEKPYKLNVSIGYASNEDGRESIPAFLARADKMLYRAKANKK